MKLLHALLLATTFIAGYQSTEAYGRASGSYSSRASSSSSFSSRASTRSIAPSLSTPSSGSIGRMNQRASAGALNTLKNSYSESSTKPSARFFTPPTATAQSTPQPRRDYVNTQPSYPSGYSSPAPDPAPAPTYAHQNSGPSFGSMVLAGMAANALSNSAHAHEHENDNRTNQNGSAYTPQQNTGLPETGHVASPFDGGNENGIPPQDKTLTPQPAPAPAPTPVTAPKQNLPASQTAQPASSGSDILENILMLTLLFGLPIGGYLIYRKVSAPRHDPETQKIKKDIFGDSDAKSVAIIPQLPLVRIGSPITISAIMTSSDPTKDDKTDGLDFEPNATGDLTISAIGRYLDNNENWNLYTSPDLTDFVSIVTNGKQITDAIFFSEIRKIANGEDGWDAFLNPDNGLMGEPDIEHAGKQWTRAVLPDEKKRINPMASRELVTSAVDGSQTSLFRYDGMLYMRPTGYSQGFPQTEYMFMRSCQTSDGDGEIAYLQILGGVNLPPTSLNLP